MNKLSFKTLLLSTSLAVFTFVIPAFASNSDEKEHSRPPSPSSAAKSAVAHEASNEENFLPFNIDDPKIKEFYDALQDAQEAAQAVLNAELPQLEQQLKDLEKPLVSLRMREQHGELEEKEKQNVQQEIGEKENELVALNRSKKTLEDSARDYLSAEKQRIETDKEAYLVNTYGKNQMDKLRRLHGKEFLVIFPRH